MFSSSTTVSTKYHSLCAQATAAFSHSLSTFHIHNIEMYFWSIFTILLSYTAQFEAAWNVKSALIVNKIGSTYAFPNYVGKINNESPIQYSKPKDEGTTIHHVKAPDSGDTSAPQVAQDEEIVTYYYCKNSTYRVGFYLTGKPLSWADSSKIFCNDSIEASNELVYLNGEKVPCGSKRGLNGFINRVSYKLYREELNSMPILEYSLIVYDYCLDPNTNEVIYTEYTIENPSLLKNDFLADERNHPFDFFANGATATYQYYQTNTDHKARAVGVPELMPFALQRKPFYRFDTAAPMNRELLEPWSIFLQKVASIISKSTESIKVYSGIYDRKRIHGVAMHMKANQLPIPYAWWVLLYNKGETKGVSLVMHNYAYSENDPKPEPICKSVCSDVGLKDSIPVNHYYAFIYCCPASTITDRFPFKPVGGLFNLDEI